MWGELITGGDLSQDRLRDLGDENVPDEQRPAKAEAGGRWPTSGTVSHCDMSQGW